MKKAQVRCQLQLTSQGIPCNTFLRRYFVSNEVSKVQRRIIRKTFSNQNQFLTYRTCHTKRRTKKTVKQARIVTHHRVAYKPKLCDLSLFCLRDLAFSSLFFPLEPKIMAAARNLAALGAKIWTPKPETLQFCGFNLYLREVCRRI